MTRSMFPRFTIYTPKSQLKGHCKPSTFAFTINNMFIITKNKDYESDKCKGLFGNYNENQ